MARSCAPTRALVPMETAKKMEPANASLGSKDSIVEKDPVRWEKLELRKRRAQDRKLVFVMGTLGSVNADRISLVKLVERRSVRTAAVGMASVNQMVIACVWLDGVELTAQSKQLNHSCSKRAWETHQLPQIPRALGTATTLESVTNTLASATVVCFGKDKTAQPSCVQIAAWGMDGVMVLMEPANVTRVIKERIVGSSSVLVVECATTMGCVMNSGSSAFASAPLEEKAALDGYVPMTAWEMENVTQRLASALANQDIQVTIAQLSRVQHSVVTEDVTQLCKAARATRVGRELNVILRWMPVHESVL